jgi:predicted permease
LSNLLTLFLNNLFPIIAVAGVGFLIQRIFQLDPRPLSTIVFYALTPALILDLLLSSDFSGSEILRMAGLATLIVMILSLVVFVLGRVLKLSSSLTAGLILTVAFMNSGNYGLSLNSYALGTVGLAWASIYFITTALLNNSLGVYIASIGTLGAREGLLRMLSVPTLYAIVIGFIFLSLDFHLPEPLLLPIRSLSAATIPAMLLVLGMQISVTGVPKNLRLISIAVALRLVLSPALAWFLTRTLGLPVVGAQAGILEAAMPAPVLATIISTEYNAEPDFVSAVVLVTTLLSPLSLTPIMSLIGV